MQTTPPDSGNQRHPFLEDPLPGEGTSPEKGGVPPFSSQSTEGGEGERGEGV